MLDHNDATAGVNEPKTARMEQRTKPRVKAQIQLAAALLGVDETTFVTSAGAQSRHGVVAWEHAVLTRYGGTSSSTYYLSHGDRRMERHTSWGSLLKEMLGRRTDTQLTRDADQLTVLDQLGEVDDPRVDPARLLDQADDVTHLDGISTAEVVDLVALAVIDRTADAVDDVTDEGEVPSRAAVAVDLDMVRVRVLDRAQRSERVLVAEELLGDEAA